MSPRVHCGRTGGQCRVRDPALMQGQTPRVAASRLRDEPFSPVGQPEAPSRDEKVLLALPASALGELCLPPGCETACRTTEAPAADADVGNLATPYRLDPPCDDHGCPSRRRIPTHSSSQREHPRALCRGSASKPQRVRSARNEPAPRMRRTRLARATAGRRVVAEVSTAPKSSAR